MSKGNENTPLLRKEEAQPSFFSKAIHYVVHQSPMIVLLLVVIGLGSANRVLYKIQLTPMGNYPLFLSWFITIAYCLLYWTILSVRRYLGIITPEMMAYSNKYLYMGLCDAAGSVIGIFAARRLTGFLLTLLPQLIIPITMIVTVIMLRTKYNLWQVLGAVIIISGEITSIVPAFKQGTSANFIWVGFYIASIVPSAISFVLKESVFTEHPSMDIFVVNSMDSAFQLVFTFASLPIVLIPGFGSVPFSELPAYITNAGFCFAGINHNPVDDCRGEPWASLLYMLVNLSWNISLLTLVKRGGAVLTFIAAAVSLPIAHLAFALNWPLLPSTPLHWEDGVALVIILAGLILYRVASMLKNKADAPKEEIEVTDDTKTRKGI